MMDEHYPNTAWLCLRRDVFNACINTRRIAASPLEQALESMLP